MYNLVIGGIAITALVISVVVFMQLPNTTKTTNTNTFTLSTSTFDVPAPEKPLVEWGGIDNSIPNPAHIANPLQHNLDSATNIYAAAIFRGSLALLDGNVVLDRASDVILAGMDETLRGQIQRQWDMQHQICILLNRVINCDFNIMHLDTNCSCRCIDPLFDIVITGYGPICVRDCNGSPVLPTGCNCTPPYTAASNCYDLTCPVNTFITLNGTCEAYHDTNVTSCPPPCADRLQALACPQRGNWNEAAVIGSWVACAPIRVFSTIILQICSGTDTTCCTDNNIKSWWSIYCQPLSTQAYCQFLGTPNLLTFDNWDDGIYHSILIKTGYPWEFAVTVFQSSLVACLGVGQLGYASQTTFSLAKNVDPQDYGSIYRIWNGPYCFLDRPFGADERIMYNTICRGVVALAVNDPDLHTDEYACGLFRVLDSEIQPYNNGLKIDWTQMLFLSTSSPAIPTPMDFSGKHTVANVTTSACRALWCNVNVLGLVSSRTECLPCLYSHGVIP